MEMRRHSINQQSDSDEHTYTTVEGHVLMIYTHNRLTIDTRIQRKKQCNNYRVGAVITVFSASI